MAKGSSVGRPRGRPTLPAEQVKRYSLGIRTTKRLKDLLQRAADSSGRSLAQEIEFRLEASLQADRFLLADYGRTPMAIIEILTRVILKVGEGAANLDREPFTSTGGDWTDNGFAFGQVVEAANAIFEAFRPGPPHPTGGLASRQGGWEDFGKMIAGGTIVAVADPDCPGEIGYWAQWPREMLSPAALQRVQAAGPKSGGRLVFLSSGEEENP